MKPPLGDVRRRKTLSIGRQLFAIDSDAGKWADVNDHHLGQRGDRDSRLVCVGGLDGRRCLRACLGWWGLRYSGRVGQRERSGDDKGSRP
jgi:hypothetical protein